MKKHFYLLAAALLLSAAVQAAPGDTTWVQAQSTVQMPNYGNFDASVSFPSGSTSYRKIYMVFTLGKYVCPGNPQYCGDWDYDVHNYVMTPTGDTLELGRLITPYAHTGTGPFAANWTYDYVFDVTDYYTVLKNNATMRIQYSGYSGGFTGNVKFAFVEGTRERNVLKVDRIWHGDYAYGHGPVDINTALGTLSKTAPAGTVSAEMKLILTGHGGDVSGGAEFLPNTYTVNLNGNQLLQQNFWRTDCDVNPISPQSGTWIYDRANWCPGALVKTYSHVLTGVTANGNYTLGLTFPAYTSVTDANHPNAASYKIDGAVIYYSALNKAVDASVEDILSPTNYEGYARMNPTCASPTIRIRNSGSATITNVKLEYGVQGTFLSSYAWTGTLAPMEEKEITLPQPWGLWQATGTAIFVAHILQVNGQTDADATNNQLTSTFTATPTWPVKLKIIMKMNGQAGETHWKVYDMNGNVLGQRDGAIANSLYTDTLTLGPGCYKLVMDDDGCDGLFFFSGTSGYLQVINNYSGFPLALNNYSPNFGCSFTQYFKTAWPTAVSNIPAQAEAAIQVYPNPARETIAVNIGGLNDVKGKIRIMDATGRTVLTQSCLSGHTDIRTDGLSGGSYLVIYTDDAGKAPRLQTRLVIAQ